MGDPAGVGPEVTVAALAEQELYHLCRPLVIGDARVLTRAAELRRLPLIVRPVAKVSEARFAYGTVDVLDLANVELERLQIGQVSALAGKAAVEYVIKAVQLAQAGEVDAIATGPLNKEAINLGGYSYIGHTELLNDLTHTARTNTMLVAGNLRVTHVTRHVPLSEVASLITKERVLETIVVTAEGLRQFGLERPRLAVAALNPHGGEGGLLGREEMEQIAPAVAEAQRMGIDAQGPYPADSVFFRAIAGEFDSVVAMYHDQGHIPVKTHDFEGSFTVTLGLPIVRTSVDHGTAFDIAWKGLASPRSMIAAIKAAAGMQTLRV
nr:4-hydroxythreonine-4-phosphate dehydrogenase PdxA [Chloroflexota bacterium]